MTSLEELSRAVGRLEGRTNALTRSQDKLINSVENLSKTLRRKTWYDSAKVVGGAFCGGFTAIMLKLVLWE